MAFTQQERVPSYNPTWRNYKRFLFCVRMQYIFVCYSVGIYTLFIHTLSLTQDSKLGGITAWGPDTIYYFALRTFSSYVCQSYGGSMWLFRAYKCFPVKKHFFFNLNFFQNYQSFEVRLFGSDTLQGDHIATLWNCRRAFLLSVYEFRMAFKNTYISVLILRQIDTCELIIELMSEWIS